MKAMRAKVWIPLLIFFGGGLLYFTLLFDPQMKWLLGKVGTNLNGAQVDVGGFKSSFTRGALTIDRISVTDPQRPTHNRLEIRQLEFAFLWDALLRFKFVVPKAVVNQILLGTPRETPGFVVPQEPDLPPGAGSSDGLMGSLEGFQENLKEGALEKFSSLLGQNNPLSSLAHLQERQLASVEEFRKLQTELLQKEGEWKNLAGTTAWNGELAKKRERLEGIKASGVKVTNPADLKEKIKAVQEVVASADEDLQKIKKSGEEVGLSVKNFGDRVKGVEDLVQKDRQFLENLMNIPQLNMKNLGVALFSGLFLSQLGKVKSYWDLYRRYFPAKGNGEGEGGEGGGLKKGISFWPTRLKGQTLEFGSPRGYPVFWLQKGVISSREDISPESGDLRGELTHLSTDPKIVGQPCQLLLQGDFKKRGILGVKAELTLDRRKEVPEERLRFSVESYPLPEKFLTQSPFLTLGFSKARGKMRGELDLKGEEMRFLLHHQFKDVEFSVQTRNELLQNLLLDSLAPLHEFHLVSQASGEWNHLKWSLESDLVDHLQKGLTGAMGKRVREARASIEKFLEEKVNGEKQKLLGHYEKVKNFLFGGVASQQKEAEGLRAEGLSQMREWTDKTAQVREVATEKANEKAKEGLGDLKKKFGF